MRVATVNVNGVRAAARKGLQPWLADAGADVVCLQEVRAPLDALLESVGDGWSVVAHECAIAGRAGVAILARGALDEPVVGLPGVDGDVHTGRWIEASIGGVRVVSVYVHSGENGTPKMDAKYAFLDAMTARMVHLRDAGVEALVMGDLNIAHTARDIRNAAGNKNTAGFLPQERAYVDRWLASGWVDVHRALAGEVDGPYTWWSQRGKAFDNDVGWRLDYQLATPGLATTAEAARVDRAPAWDARWSDHAPLVVDYAYA